VEVGPVSYSSPVLASDGTIYVGNTDGELVAVKPDGTIKWKRSFPGQIISSPAVGANGHIYVISVEKTGEKSFVSTLWSLAPAHGVNLWYWVFPGNRVVTASPKTVGSFKDDNNQEIGLHVFVSFLGGFVILDDADHIVNQENIFNYGSNTVCGSGFSFGDIIDAVTDFFSKAFACWEFALPPCQFNPSVPPPVPLYENFGWLDPTVAVSAPRKLDPLSDHFIVVVGGPFAIVAFRWSWPTLWRASTLTSLWSEEYGEDCSDDNYKDLSSPMVGRSDSVVVVGRKDGHVIGYDINSGARRWDYNAKAPVMATPVSFGASTYVVVNSSNVHRLDVLDNNGELSYQYAMSGQSVASPALSFVLYVSATDGLYAFSPSSRMLLRKVKSRVACHRQPSPKMEQYM
jgi:hypothetical protein